MKLHIIERLTGKEITSQVNLIIKKGEYRVMYLGEDITEFIIFGLE